MATRSTIAKKNEDGTITQIYCHWDGYIKGGVGQTLVEKYNTPELIDQLLALGSLSSLRDKIAPTEGEHTFDNPQDDVTIAYNRDRGDEWSHTKPITYRKSERREKEEFNYIFKNGDWFVTLNDSKREFSVTSSF